MKSYLCTFCFERLKKIMAMMSKVRVMMMKVRVVGKLERCFSFMLPSAIKMNRLSLPIQGSSIQYLSPTSSKILRIASDVVAILIVFITRQSGTPVGAVFN